MYKYDIGLDRTQPVLDSSDPSSYLDVLTPEWERVADWIRGDCH
jgi:hypothetical protein